MDALREYHADLEAFIRSQQQSQTAGNDAEPTTATSPAVAATAASATLTPDFSLAAGTVLFTKEASERTPLEAAYVDYVQQDLLAATSGGATASEGDGTGTGAESESNTATTAAS